MTTALPISKLRKLTTRNTRRKMKRVRTEPIALASVIRPAWNAEKPEAELQQQRQQKHRRGRADVEQAAARDRRRECADAQQPEVDDRIVDAPGVAEVEHAADRAAADQRR